MLHPREVLRGKAPSNISASPDVPGIRAWDVHQDRIEGFRIKWRRVLQPIEQDNCGVADTKPDQVLLEARETEVVVITGDEDSLIFHALRHVSRFAAGCCTSIENDFPRFRIQ